ncbi:MAG: hypothetical protein A2W52_04075 [Candidatus Taylorbacteria bacterium RIFCSPHIGHO2_02_49_25]|uniref:Uncharacterized protein n=1 Tax=Candidatus Taylorbacteria bacterium RIFCSPHIGHO2_02_49_25 TaxID=1802305 RepID=A0A1G2MHK5_9BACT|nr:MAG: hypothetical protein UY62_C0053G0003 [Parcubacteria group bacterium GW2011_GWF2_50_9]OHA20429.1 MAG: hypothetical protein A2759_02070 [Candidatus Taylorbacteria bacterium RIFCSPHIGHO2_01_FULL_49_60]OHA23323.1 MAG: hypothetical protein A2W52_04075 [Candidatus Taylorbacteria bacterium RIFCSPHIGHO2_02_49_25]OHA36634.1 MAG: hypothetical protein A2W65_00920 [Candidatus Taylorbacteria bacterium RIFCSPLOWO2_02_50_13]OHA41644.1 MAG: hypothetical protein A3H73_02990 [Candidatus Taylorbacteria ba
MQKAERDGSFWAFALINGRLAEFDFEVIRGKFYMGMGHCYVKRSEYKTKKEQKWIDNDIKRYRFTYRNKKYRRVGERAPLPVKRYRISKKIEKGMSFEEQKSKLKLK